MSCDNSMQPMPILTLCSSKSMLGLNLFRPAHMYINTNFLQRRGYMLPWLLPHKMLISAIILQTFSFSYMQNCIFSFTMQLQDMNIEGEN